MLLPASNGVDDTTVINVALAMDRCATGRAGETYRISAPLIIGSGTLLDMTGCTVQLLAGSDCNMLRTATDGRTTDIIVQGGTWARGDNHGAGNDLHSLFLRHADRVTVRDLRVTSTAGKYAIALGDVTEARVHDVSFDTASDGVHVTGPATAVDIRGITGRTGDDQVSLTGRDYASYDDVHGDITGVTIDGVHCAGSLAAVKIISGTDTKVSGVSVSRVRGTTTIRPIAIIDDKTGPTVADGILLEDLDVQCTNPAWSLIWLRGVASTDVTIRDVRLRRPCTNNLIVLIDRTTRIAALTIEGLLLDPGAITQAGLVGVFGTAHVGALRLSRVRIPAAIGWTGQAVVLGGGGTVDSSITADICIIAY